MSNSTSSTGSVMNITEESSSVSTPSWTSRALNATSHASSLINVTRDVTNDVFSPSTWTSVLNSTGDVTSMSNVTKDVVTSSTISTWISSLNSTEASNFATSFNASDVFISLNDSLTFTSDPNVTNTTSFPVTSTTGDVVLAKRITTIIDLWVPPFLAVIGIVANVFVVLVMQSKYFRHMSTSFYMAVSSVVDTISLVVSLPAHYLYVNFPHVFDSVRDSHVMCSFFNLFGWGSSDMGVLLTVAMTTDRSLAIQFPLKAPTLCTVKRAKIVTVCLFLFEILKVGHLVVTSRVSPKEVTSYLCDVDRSSESYRIFYDNYWPYLHNLFLVISFIVIIIGNVIITVHVKRSEDSKDIGEGAKSSGGSKPGKTTSKSRQLSLMLIIDSATIIICTLPFAIYVVVAQAFQLFDDSPEDRAQQSLIFSITFYLLYVNRCANFFLYCISGARFRQALKDILCRKSAAQKNNYITGATNTRNMTSSTFASEGDTGNKVCMNPMGPSTSAAARNGGAKRTSTSFSAGPSTISDKVVNGRSKLERHYGYGKSNGK